jgi:hypothetical protein
MLRFMKSGFTIYLEFIHKITGFVEGYLKTCIFVTFR